MSKANDIIKNLERHCGATVDNKRLRFQIVRALASEIKRREDMETGIKAVITGEKTYDPRRKKAIHIKRDA